MNYVVSDTDLTSIANAIRAKTLKTDQIQFPNGFTSELGSIVSMEQIQPFYYFDMITIMDMNSHEIAANGEYTHSIQLNKQKGMFLPLNTLSYDEQQRVFKALNVITATFTLTATGGTDGLSTSYSYRYENENIYLDYAIMNSNSSAKTVTQTEISYTMSCRQGYTPIPS